MLDAKRAPGLPPLSQLYVYLTNYCNCACKHCWIISESVSSEKKPSLSLAPEVFGAAVMEAKPLGLSAIKWTGGEPTIHPDFPGLLRLQKEHGLVGRMETNGMEITPSLANLLLESGVKDIGVSLDGVVPDTHDAIRGVVGAYQRALTGFKNLVEAGFKPQIVMSLMQKNIPELDGLLDLAKRIGAGSIKLNLVQPTLRGLEIHESGQALSVQEVLDLKRRIDWEIQPLYSFPIHLDVPPAFRSIKSLLKQGSFSVCGIKTILGLLADGSYALCGIGENIPELVFGKAGQGKLKTIWEEHPIVLQIRNNLPAGLKGVCGQCLMKSACLGSCVAQNYYRSKDILAAFWFCEEAEAEGLFPKTRIFDKQAEKEVLS